MAKKSSDPAASAEPSVKPVSKREAPVFAVASDPAFFERLCSECSDVPQSIVLHTDIPGLMDSLARFDRIGLAFVLFVERKGRDIDATLLRRLRLDYPQLVLIAALESCDHQSELRLGSIGVHSILLPPFKDVSIEKEIATALPNVPQFKRHPDLMRRGQARLDFLIPSDLAYVLGVNYEISLLLKEFGFPPQDTRINIPLACDEAITNAIVHGNESHPDKKVNIQIYVSNSRFRIRVRDQGPGFDYEAVADPREGENVHRSSGRGIFLMRSIMDRVLEMEKMNPNGKAFNNGSE
jgi:serine/threonine-protein kinase RsbW